MNATFKTDQEAYEEFVKLGLDKTSIPFESVLQSLKENGHIKTPNMLFA